MTATLCCRRCGGWRTNETHYCEGCGLYHYANECVDPYFNEPDNWCDCKGIFHE